MKPETVAKGLITRGIQVGSDTAIALVDVLGLEGELEEGGKWVKRLLGKVYSQSLTLQGEEEVRKF